MSRTKKEKRIYLATVRRTGELILVQSSAKKKDSYDKWEPRGVLKPRKYCKAELDFKW